LLPAATTEMPAVRPRRRASRDGGPGHGRAASVSGSRAPTADACPRVTGAWAPSPTMSPLSWPSSAPAPGRAATCASRSGSGSRMGSSPLRSVMRRAPPLALFCGNASVPADRVRHGLAGWSLA